MLQKIEKWIMPTIASILIIVCYLVTPTIDYSHPETSEISFKTLEKQPDGITCGPTSVTMVLNYYKFDVKLDDVKVKTKTEWGNYGKITFGMTSPENITKAMNEYGLESKLKQGDIKQLKYFISKKLPVIVLLRSSRFTWHYVVAIGYDKENIFIADPASGKKEKITLDNFKGAWNFETDMRGQSTDANCEFCKGSGKFSDVEAGPLTTCPLCDGYGKVPDLLSNLLYGIDVYPNFMIVPLKTLSQLSK